ncbi:MAG: hypothetical protein M3O50_05315, partial [Myxococcota bacterium]|nr:hypothetical protein [Myxococcota bacterium]
TGTDGPLSRRVASSRRGSTPLPVFALLALLAVTACARKPVALAAHPAREQAPAPAVSATAPRSMQVVNATILANHCQDLGRANARLAEAAMYRLVEGCRSVPGGSARFEATLNPVGTIAIAAVSGDPEVVPICILKHSLTHHVTLSAPCRLDVQIEEQTVSVTEVPEGGAPSSSAGPPPPR